MQSAKQMMAAKKAAKQKRQEQKSPKKIERNLYAKQKYQQYENQLDMRKGTPFNEDAILTDLIFLQWQLKDLIYSHPVEAVRAFIHIMRCYKVVAIIYNDKTLDNVIIRAMNALDKAGEQQDASPNQKRKILAPLYEFTLWVETYSEIIPRATTHNINAYSNAINCLQYITDYYEISDQIRTCFVKSVNGESIFKLAKEIGKKTNELKEEILNTADYFYEAMKCYGDLPRPKSLADFRNTNGNKWDWKKFFEDDGAFLVQCIKHNMEQNIIPFEKFTGISLIDRKELESKLKQMS